jgi:hypothetical protein
VNTSGGFTIQNISVTNPVFVGGIPWSQNGIPPRPINSVAVDPFDVTGMTAYAAFSGFAFVGTDAFGGAVNDPLGHIFKTTTGGQNWIDVSCSKPNCSTPAVTDLPNVPVNDVVVDPDLPNTLYAATDLGVFIGDCSASPCTWSTLGTGLPRVAVLSLRLHEASRTLRAGTHGRGAWDIILNNFTFSGPHISSISPVSQNAGGATFTLTVNGSGLTGGAVQWNGAGVTTTPVSDTQLTATIAASLLSVAGTPPVTVKVGTQTSNSLPFAVLAATPKITSIVPTSTPVQTPTPATDVQIQINGTGFSSSARVFFNGAQNGITVAAPTSSCPLPTCLKATLPASLLGPFGSTNDIQVFNFPPGGGKSAAQSFRVVAPPPPNDNFANATTITTLGFDEFQDTSGATTESSDPVPPCATQFTVAQGNTGGQRNGAYNSVWYKFMPQFSANLTIFVTFTSYDSVLSIWTGTQGALTSIACNDDADPGVLGSVVANLPLTAGTTYYIMVSSFGPPDPNPLALGGDARFLFTYNGGVTPAPTLTSISPTSANSGDPGFTLTVNGSGFLSGAFVDFVTDASHFEPTTFVSSTKLTAAIPASEVLFPGTYTIFVDNQLPTAGPSNSISFKVNVGTYPVPTLTSISPNSVVAGGLGFTLNAFGTNYASTATLNFNGSPRVTTFFDSTRVSASILASDIATIGTAQITVTNPTPGGGPSTQVALGIIQPNPVPTITSVTPSTVQSGTNVGSLDIVGANFVYSPSVYFNGSVNGAAFIDSTHLTAFLNPGALSPGTYPLVVIDPYPGGLSLPFNITVTPPPPRPDFSITAAGTTSQAVNAGATATFTDVLTVTPQNGFTSAVSLSCSIVATASHCSVNPTSLTNGSATVTVTTTARGLLPPTSRFRWFNDRPFPVFLVFVAAILSAMLYLIRFRRPRYVCALPLAAVALYFALHAAGCGGGYSAPPPPPPPVGTQAGTYTITVTATSGNLTHTTTLTLVVN